MSKQSNSEKENTNRERFWDKFLSTKFSTANKLDQREFENTAKGYNHIYGKLLPTDKTAKILDIGCGAGHFLYYLDKKGYKNYKGIDISPEQVEFVKANITEKVEVADAFNFLNGVKEEYDVIVGNDIIEHILKRRLIEIMDLIYATLKPNGMCCLKTGNMSAPFALSLRYIDITHEMGFTDKSLVQLFKVANFQRVEIYPKPSERGIKQRIGAWRIKLAYRVLFGVMAPEVLGRLIIGVGFKRIDKKEESV
jgi:2-polyprenyl-3-methyl-5-hydroxy-6-metoxy-1,4-benzoquinol methylase